MDRLNGYTTCSDTRDYDHTFRNRRAQALVEQDDISLCLPDPSTSQHSNITQCYVDNVALNPDSNILSEATYGGYSNTGPPPNSSTSHIAYPLDDFPYGDMEKMYGYPPMQQYQAMHSQAKEEPTMNRCHYNILEYVCGHSILQPTLPYISHVDTCNHLAQNIPNITCKNMGVASLSTSTSLCHACQKAYRKTRSEDAKVPTVLNNASTESENRSDISMADIDSIKKVGAKYKVQYGKIPETEDIEVLKGQGAHIDEREILKAHIRERDFNTSEVLRRVSVLRDSRLNQMQNAVSQRNASVAAKSGITFASSPPLHRNMRKEGIEDAENQKRMLRNEKDGIDSMRSKDSKGKSSSNLFRIPEEKPDSTKSDDQFKWFSWSDPADLDHDDPTLPELVSYRYEPRFAATHWTGDQSQPLNDMGSAAAPEKPKTSATEMLKNVYEKDAKLPKMRTAGQAHPVQSSSSKPRAMSQGSETQPEKPVYVSKATQMTEDVSSAKAVQMEPRNCTHISQGTQTIDPYVASNKGTPSQTLTLPIRAAQEYACKIADKSAAASTTQSQRHKPVMVSIGTQVDEYSSIEIDPTVKGEKESEWEDMDVGKNEEAEDADWEFIDM